MASSTSVRFPDALKSEAMAYADSLGVSLNALCAIALRDYLDDRAVRAAETTAQPVAEPARPREQSQPSPAPVERPAADAAVHVGLDELARAVHPPVKRKKNRRKR